MIEIKLKNASSFKSRMKSINNKISDMSIPHKKISIMLDRWVQDNFRSEGRKIGGWASIKREGRILQKSGRLRSSFIPFANLKDAGIGSDLPYSEIHEKGIGVRKRRILPIQKEVHKDIVTVYEKHIKDSAK